MPIRDILLTLIVVGSLPMILRRPFVGLLVWSWLSYMNPHRLVWDFAYGQPFAQVVAIVTIIGILFSSETKKIPWSPTLTIWISLVGWTCITTFFAIDPERSQYEFELFLKIQFMTLLTLMLINSRERLIMVVWVIVASLGFYGLKGGVFTILTGGKYQVLGPEQSFIEGNNELSFALIMTLPLIQFLRLNSKSKWIRLGLLVSLGLFAFSIVGSQSRGAFLAAAAMALFMFFRSRRKFLLGLGTAIAILAIVMFMPAEWFERMETIKNYEQDGSAMGRINAWRFAVNLAMDRPLVGGGFDTFTRPLFFQYAPEPLDFHDSHSIYFEVLGEHGFVGLALFLGLFAMVWRQGSRIIKLCRDRLDLLWANDLARMGQASMVGYAVGGAFLGRAYFDLYYHVLAIILITQVIAVKQCEAAVDPVLVAADLPQVPEGTPAGAAEKRRSVR